MSGGSSYMRVDAGVVGCTLRIFSGRASRSSGLIIGTGGCMHEGENTGMLRIDERRLLDLTERTEERFACGEQEISYCCGVK
jgi:hypothetical protein